MSRTESQQFILTEKKSLISLEWQCTGKQGSSKEDGPERS